MTTNLPTEATRPLKFNRNQTIQKIRRAADRQHILVIWVTLIGIFFPQVLISLGFINVTPGRIIVLLLFIPALLTLLKSGRSRVISDFFAVALAAWMLGS